MDFLSSLFDLGQFMPHGHCYFWTPGILWSQVIADAVIALSYYSIPLVLLVFVTRRKDLNFRWVFILFLVFICACGTTHLMSIITTWLPYYRLESLVKVVTAAASVVTAAILWPLLPKVLALPSPQQLEALNSSLESKVNERTQALNQRSQELGELNAELRQFNDLAIGREERIIALKREVNLLAAALGRAQPYDLSGLDTADADARP